MAELPKDAKAVFYRQYGPYGRETPSTFNFIVEKTDKIKTITISSGYIVDGIGFEIVDQSGNSKTMWYGGHGGKTHTLTFQNEENITQISGSFCTYRPEKKVNVSQISIHTNVVPNGYGPFGQNDACSNIKSFKSPAGPVVGFFGAAGDYLQSIGVSVRTDDV